jgi:neopullulanase
LKIQTPEWVKHAVFYQVFPDRFARSPRVRLPPGISLKPWGAPPEKQGFQGGNLLGVVDRLDYLQDLGVTALYLNPIFASASNHRYHTYDYFQVDPLLGGNEALRELLDQAHDRNIRIVLDGVFNHAGRGFWAFHHILETGGNSPYLDWFIIRDWPLRPYHSDKKHPPNYGCWWELPALPKFNIKNPGVREYLLKVARHWIEFGIDGWRLDVAEEIKDKTFWQEFRRVVKEANPEAYLCGEIWRLAPEWLQGDRFDGLMNYPLAMAVMGFFGARTLAENYKMDGKKLKPLTAEKFSTRIDKILSSCDWEVSQGQLNLLDSHDTARLLWMLGGDKTALKLCVLFQMTMPGAPCIYYGDEIGMNGGHEPHSRAAFPWQNENQWDTDLRQFYRNAIALRHRYTCLRSGDYRSLHAGKGIFAFGRKLGKEKKIVIFNTRKKAKQLAISTSGFAAKGEIFTTLWGEAGAYRAGDKISIPAQSALVMTNAGEK